MTQALSTYVPESSNSYEPPTGRRIVRSSDVMDVILDYIPQMSYEEHFAVLHLDPNGYVITGAVVATGTSEICLFSPTQVFRRAVSTRDCSSIVLVHNHPDGNPTPSRMDIETTARLMACGDLLGIHVMDHIVIGLGNRSYVSIREDAQDILDILMGK